MNYKKILIFDVTGEYGHFRKYNTTTSPLTYSIPTRIALAGMVGAVLGMEREISDGVYKKGVVPVNEFFRKGEAEFAVQILKPVKKVNIGFNLINTKHSFNDLTKAGHTQIEFELLKNPKFRIFLHLENEEKIEELRKRIMERKHHFTPYLGLAQFTANLNFVDFVDLEDRYNENEYIELITAVNLSKTFTEQPIKFDYSKHYSANNTPVHMDSSRVVHEYSEILVETNGYPIKAKIKEYWFVQNYGNILFL